MVHLAYEQGLLKQKDLNEFQQWALSYWIGMDRRLRLEDRRSELEWECFHLNPERWTGLYYEKYFKGITPEDQEVPVTDIDDIDQFMAQIEGKRFMSGIELDDDGWLT